MIHLFTLYLQHSAASHQSRKANSLPIPLSNCHQHFLSTIPRKWLVSLVARSLVDLSRFQGPDNERERAQFVARLNNTSEVAKIRQEIRKYYEESVSPEQIMVGICVEKNLEEKSLKQSSL